MEEEEDLEVDLTSSEDVRKRNHLLVGEAELLLLPVHFSLFLCKREARNEAKR